MRRMPYEMILTETQGKVAVIRLNRPQALNALCDQLMTELGEALRGYDADPAIAAIVVTGSERAFAAGADIKEMKDRTFPAVYLGGPRQSGKTTLACNFPAPYFIDIDVNLAGPLRFRKKTTII
jgi:enoyl-CoA hydratase/carnithine racemase